MKINIIILPLAVVLLAACKKDSTIVTPPDTQLSGKVVYVAQLNEQGVRVMNADGSNNFLLVGGGGFQTPLWSSDGRKIAFLKLVEPQDSNEVYVMNSDGSNLTKVFTGQFARLINWASSSDRIMVRADSSAYSVAADGSSQARVLTGNTSQWYPVGNKVNYTMNDGIWLANPDGSSAQRLSDIYAFNYAWSQTALLMVIGTPHVTNNTVTIVDFSIGQSTPLSVPSNLQVGQLSMAMNGNRAVFRSFHVQGTSQQMYLVDVPAKTLTQVSTDSLWYDYPIFTSDGIWIIFVKHTLGNGGPIFAMQFDKTDLKQISNGQDDRYPDWKP